MVGGGEGAALPKEAMESIILVPGEEIMDVWYASYKYRPKPNPSNTPSTGNIGLRVSIGAMSGFLILTNRRLAFISSKGLLSNSYSVALAINYEDILGIDCGGSNHAIRISYRGSYNEPAVLCDFMEPRELTADALTVSVTSVPSLDVKEMLSQRIAARLKEIDDERKKAPTQIIIDFNSLKSILEKGGILVQSMKCPTCGANIGIPEAGAIIKCEYCGTSVKAIDLLERIKELINAQNQTTSIS